TEFTNIYQGFTNGNFAMTITGPWNVSEIRSRAPQLKDKWSTAPMPRKKNRNSVAGGASLIIFQSSKKPEAAWRLIEYLSESQTQLEFFRLTRDLPAVRSTWNNPELQNDEEINAFYQQLQSVQPTPPIAEWEQVAVKIQEHLEKVVYNQITLEEAVIQLNRDVNQILEKRRWLLSNDLLTSPKSY
ncbi:MAG: extracellular solute-binding protein, partial [Aliifodinibius sp.]|nr:extracellular solute-binding protein [Fodinibius sp.]NIW44902.1 extracellular solute-binding protein [Gammaproteobacteria bacterium]NIW97955.1 extracellular solute-binding protein [Phycisphaerae bacterium]NIY25620.1 extracellular solute-binding protein [Fodinibius sp.]